MGEHVQRTKEEEKAHRMAKHVAKQAALEAERELVKTLPAFQPWPKISRLNREIVVSEKIDGTNAAICVGPVISDFTEQLPAAGLVWAQSRTRIITPNDDNFGFARWVQENADALRFALGPGIHFGEWYGQGIQRGYGLDHKRFALFNVEKYVMEDGSINPDLLAIQAQGVKIELVQTIYRGPWTQTAGFVAEPESFRPRYMPNFLVEFLAREGSQSVPGWKKPEGIVVFHRASGTSFKVTCENDEQHKMDTRP